VGEITALKAVSANLHDSFFKFFPVADSLVSCLDPIIIYGLDRVSQELRDFFAIGNSESYQSENAQFGVQLAVFFQYYLSVRREKFVEIIDKGGK